MNQASHQKLISFIWSIANDCLRDVYVRGKYRDVILPMVVLRRLDALLEGTKEQLLDEVRFQREEAGLVELDENALFDVTGYQFYNTSKWTLQGILSVASNNQALLEDRFMEYFNGFDSNVKEIIEKFKLRSQVRHMLQNNVMVSVLEKFTSPYINLTPESKLDPDGRTMPSLSNLGMGYVFEELIRKFNEENNEEAGEHFTPREVIELMTHMLILPVKDELPPVITVYDPACGSGGMLTESQNFINDVNGTIQSKADVYLYGKEINPETYAICKSDMMIKGNSAQNIRCGSTLSTNEFQNMGFDFCLSNPPYGKSYSKDLPDLKDGNDIIDDRFKLQLRDYWGEVVPEDGLPRSSDGQLLFLMEMVTKMKSLKDSPFGTRIASVHNGSSLFTGNAGGGESNIRRHLFEGDMVEAIVQLPENLFYNTGITTYVWLLTNKKRPGTEGKVALIDASQRFEKLKKNLGEKNCELKEHHIKEVLQALLNFDAVERMEDDDLAVKVFDNAEFGYHQVTVERPLRLMTQFTDEKIETLRFNDKHAEIMKWAWEEFGDEVYSSWRQKEERILSYIEEMEMNLKEKDKKQLLDPKIWSNQKELMELAHALKQELGQEVFDDFNDVEAMVKQALKARGLKIGASQKKKVLEAVSWEAEEGMPVIDKELKMDDLQVNQLATRLRCSENDLVLYGYYPGAKSGLWLTYKASTALRDDEQVPYEDDVLEFVKREVTPHRPDAWIDIDKIKLGCEVSFNKHFFRPKKLRSVEDIARDILLAERASDGMIANILGGHV